MAPMPHPQPQWGGTTWTRRVSSFSNWIRVQTLTSEDAFIDRAINLIAPPARSCSGIWAEGPYMLMTRSIFNRIDRGRPKTAKRHSCALFRCEPTCPNKRRAFRRSHATVCISNDIAPPVALARARTHLPTGERRITQTPKPIHSQEGEGVPSDEGQGGFWQCCAPYSKDRFV